MQTIKRRYYTVPEVMTILGISRSLAYASIWRGDIPSIRVGRSIRVPCEPIDRLAQAEGE